MQFNIHEAKTQFSKLVAAVERGETVTICRNGRPVIACVPARSPGPFPFGAWGSLPGGTASLDHMVGPSDGETLDAMGL
jgi:prevent-host-death family protein